MPATKLLTLDLRVGEQADSRLQKHLAAVVDDEDGEQLRQAAEDRGEDVAGDVSQRCGELLASATRKPSARPNGSVARARRIVSQAPEAISSPQPSGPKLSRLDQVRQETSPAAGLKERRKRPAPAAGQSLGMPSP